MKQKVQKRGDEKEKLNLNRPDLKVAFGKE
jgi:hypothetical protein